MKKTLLALTIMFAGQMVAGGFYLQVGNPEASARAAKMGAAVTVKVAGCHDPASAKVTANAIGTVNGERRTIPLELKPLGEPGFYALTQQWPKEGKWVIQFQAHADDLVTSTLVAAGPKVDYLHPRSEMKAFAAADVEAMLH